MFIISLVSRQSRIVFTPELEEQRDASALYVFAL
jgi:hypothetical protein